MPQSPAKNRLPLRNKTKKGTLHQQAHSNDVESIKQTLKVNNDPDVEDEQGNAPLHYAAYVGHFAACKVLVKAEAEVDKRTQTGHTSLAFAACNGHVDVVDLLINSDANIELSTKQHRFRPLHLATFEGRSSVVDVLLRARANTLAKTQQGWTPMHCAAQAGQLEVSLRLLVANKEAMEKADHTGSTPLHAAVRAGNPDVVRLLLSKNADPDARNNAGETVLTVARRLGNSDIIRAIEVGVLLGEEYHIQEPPPIQSEHPSQGNHAKGKRVPHIDENKSSFIPSSSAPDLIVQRENGRGHTKERAALLERERQRRERSHTIEGLAHNLPFTGGGFLATAPIGKGFLSQSEIPGHFTGSRKHNRVMKVEHMFQRVFSKKGASRAVERGMQPATKQHATEIAELMALEVQFQNEINSAKQRAALAEGNARNERNPDLLQTWLQEERIAMEQSRTAAAHLSELKYEVQEYVAGQRGLDVREHLGLEFLLNVHNSRRHLSPLSKRVKAPSNSAPTSPDLSARSPRPGTAPRSEKFVQQLPAEKPFRKARLQSPMRNLTIKDALSGTPRQHKDPRSAMARAHQESQPSDTGPVQPELESTKMRRTPPPFTVDSNVHHQKTSSGASYEKGFASEMGPYEKVSSSERDPRPRSRSPPKVRSRSPSPEPAQSKSASARSQSDPARPRVNAAGWTFISETPKHAMQAHRAPALSGRKQRGHSDDRRIKFENMPSDGDESLQARGKRLVVGNLAVDVDGRPKAHPQGTGSGKQGHEGKAGGRANFTEENEEIFYFVGMSEADDAA